MSIFTVKFRLLNKLLKISGSIFTGLLIFLIAWFVLSKIHTTNGSPADGLFNTTSAVFWIVSVLVVGISLFIFIQKSLFINKLLRVSGRIFLVLFLLLAGFSVFINSSAGQNWIVKQVTKRLSRDLQTKVIIQRVDLALFNKMELKGVLIKDHGQDTLLYARDMEIRITDWFFFKKQAELKYIGLEDAVIKFQRTDSVWSQQFIFDYFASPSTGKQKKAGIEFNLKKIDLKNVLFVKKDAWLGQDMSIRVGQLDIDANDLSLSGQTYDINSLNVIDPVVTLYNYKSLRPDRPVTFEDSVTKDVVDSILKWNSDGLVIKIGQLKIQNGVFRNDNQDDQPVLPGFDGQHIEFSRVNSEMTAVQFTGDTIYSKFKLSARERSGFEVKSMVADMKMTPQGMAFSNLDIHTNSSVIKNFFSMSYDDFSSMDDFIHKVKMQGNFDSSVVDSDDIAFFAPSMKTWNKKITLNGKVRGTVDALVGKEMIIRAGTSTLLDGDISLTGLPDIDQTFIDFKANNFKTTYADAVTIVPAMRQVTSPDLRKIQYAYFKGSFTGFIRDFVAFGTLQTNLGTITSDLNMKLPRGRQPVYSGTISTDNFGLGEFLGDENMGALSMKGVIKGSGFNEKNRNATIDGTIQYVDYNHYRYNNIVIKGKLDKKLFDGVASINDPEADLTLNGVIDLNNKEPVFNFLADVRKANLKNLKLTTDDIAFNGKFDLNFTGNSLDNFLGTARITDATITRDGNRLPFDSLILVSAYANNVKTLGIQTNELTGSIRGEFDIKELPNAFQLFLNRYYPSYIKAPARLLKNQSFSFDFVTRDAEEYIKLVDTTLSGFNNSHITGDLNMATNVLNLNADIPQFKYKKYNFDNVNLQGKGTLDSLTLYGKASNIFINDSLNVPQAIFTIAARNDSSKVSVYTGANQAVDKASINALVLTYNDGVKIEFDPSDFVINGKTWAIDQNGELQFRKNIAASGQLTLREGDQQIKINTQSSPKGDWNDIKVELTRVNIGDFSPYFMPQNRLEGLASGTVFIEDPLHKFNAKADISADRIILDNDSIGSITSHLDYNNTTGELTGNGKTLNPEHKLDFDLSLFLKDKLKEKNNHIGIQAYRYPIKILERFLNTLFSDLEGYITGPVDLNGPLDELNISGKAKLEDAGLKVNFTQCFYKIENTGIELTPNEIKLDGIVLKDPVTGNPVYLNGGIQHESFRNMFFDLSVSTRKPGTSGDQFNKPVLLLNTTSQDNKQFYGRVKGTGSFSLTGPESEMFMQIGAIASKTDSSYITIPSSSSRESGIADFLVERKFGHEMDNSGLNNNTSNIIYDVDITANPMLNAKVILDELTGDEIKGRGTGTLNIHSGSAEPLTIRGRYDINDGNYLFTFQSFFKKPFVLKKDADNYIEWSGDPYKAKVHFDAIYKAENVSFAPLATLLQSDANISRARGDVYVVASLSDELFKPTIKFTLDFPSSSIAVTDPGLAFNIQQIQKNTNDINKQVTYLIVFNTFAPSEQGSSSGSGININDIATTTISGIFLGVINGEINKVFSKLFKDDKLSFNLNTSIYNRNMIDPNNKTAFDLGSNVNFTIGRSFLNDRFIIIAGGGFEAPLQQSSIQQTVQLLPDVTMEWLINETGTIRASFFYREDADYLTTAAGGGPGRARRYGGNLSYRKEFDNLKELFKKKPPKEKIPPPVQTPEVNKDANKDDEVPKQ